MESYESVVNGFSNLLFDVISRVGIEAGESVMYLLRYDLRQSVKCGFMDSVMSQEIMDVMDDVYYRVTNSRSE